jgi:hypothetical protein
MAVRMVVATAAGPPLRSERGGLRRVPAPAPPRGVVAAAVCDGRDRDVIDEGGVQGAEGEGAMQANAGLRSDRARCGHLDPIRATTAQVPLAKRRAMAEFRLVPTCEDSGEEGAVERKVRPADGEDAPVLAMETLGLDAVCDLVLREPEFVQDASRDDAMSRGVQDQAIHGWAVEFGTIASATAHAPERGGERVT